MPVRVVFDSNIFVAAALNPGKYADLWLRKAALKKKLELYISPQILNEVHETLENKFHFSRENITQFLGEVEIIAQVIRPTIKLDVIKNDPDDNMVLECAVEAKADLLVTSDPDLFKLKKFQGIGIIHPSDLKYIFPEELE